MHRGLSLALLVLLMVPQMAAAQSSLSLKLTLNNTNHNVYVPGAGEMASSGLGPETIYGSPPHYYIASYLSGLLIAMASGEGQFLSTGSVSGNHTIGFEQGLGKPVFLAFTRGDWQTIDGMAGDMESGEFLRYVSPSFAFGLGTYHPLKVALRYTGIDIGGSLGASRGIYKLVIENKGQSAGRPLVEITG